MSGVNKVIILGRLGADPETRYTGSGTAVTSIRIATSEKWTDKQTGQKQERTEWHGVTFFGRLAEVAAEYLKKGGQVYVEGSLRTEKYTDKEGIERYTTKIMANELQMISGARDAKPDEQPRSAPARTGRANKPTAPPASNSDRDTPFDDDDIPF